MYFYEFFKNAWFVTGIPLILNHFFKKITYTLSLLLPTSNAAFCIYMTYF